MKKPHALVWNSLVAIKEKSLQIKQILLLTLVSVLLFLVSVGFSLLLSSTTLQKYTVEAILGAFENTAVQLQTTINRGLTFGRPLAGFAGLEDHLRRVQATAPGISNISIYALAENSTIESDALEEIVMSLNGEQAKENSPQDLASNGKIEGSTQWYAFDNYHRILPLQSEDAKKTQGYLVLSVDKDIIQLLYNQYLDEMLFFILFLGFFTSVGLLGWFAYTESALKNSPKMQSRVTSIVLGFIATAQIIFAILTVQNFVKSLDLASDFSSELSGSFLASDLELLQNKNLHVQNFPGLSDHMQEILESSPSMGAMQLVRVHSEEGETENTLLTSVGLEFGPDPVTVPVYDYWTSPYVPRTEVARIEIFQSRGYLEATFKRMFLDQATSSIVAFILLWRLTAFAIVNIFSTKARKEENAPDTAELNILSESQIAQNERQRTFLEAALFIFFSAYDLAISFVPLVTAQLPSNILPFAPSVLKALPISAEATLATLAVVVSGVLNKRFGWKNLLYLGILSAMIGATLSYIGYDIALFIAARAFSGFGMGMFLMACQISVIESSQDDKNARLRGLSGVFAALFAGSVCGSASGGMLYDLFSFNILFAITAIMMFIPFFLVSFLRRDALCIISTIQEKAQSNFKAFFSLSFLVPVLFVSFPAGMLLTGFLYLAVPTSVSALGISQADIGRLFMLYGFCFIFIGPFLATFASKFKSQKYFVMLTGLTNGASLLISYLHPSYTSFAVAVVVFGISQCLLSSSMLEYILALPKMQTVDKSIISSVCRTCERSGQIVGPMLFSLLLVRDSAQFYILGAAIMGLAILFILLQSLSAAKSINQQNSQSLN